jgi:excisionase family DNA binding protein
MHDGYNGEHETITIPEAAKRLGISEPAVRQRIRRKTLAAQRLDGKLYVVLSAGYDEPSPSSIGVHHGEHDGVASAVRDAYTDLVTQLRSENGLLREQLAVKDEQIRANQIMLAQLTDRMRSLPSPPQPEPETREQAPVRPVPVPSRHWWKRLFESG